MLSLTKTKFYGKKLKSSQRIGNSPLHKVAKTIIGGISFAIRESEPIVRVKILSMWYRLFEPNNGRLLPHILLTLYFEDC